MATMKDVAKLAGVSHGTVSNIINGARGVNLEKVQRVEKAMYELNYEPNAMARNLKLNKTMQFDVILPNINTSSLTQIFTYISRLATVKGYAANLRITNEDADFETKILNQALRNNKDGVILMTCQPQNTLLFDRLESSGLNLVFIEREVGYNQYNFVGIDVLELVKNSVLELAQQGHKEIAAIVGPLEYSFEECVFNGYVEACRESAIDVDEQYCATVNYDREDAFKEAFRILNTSPRPSAIVASNTQSSEAVLKAVQEMGISAAETPIILTLLASPWTFVEQKHIKGLSLPYENLAHQSFIMLLNNMDKKPDGKVDCIKLKPEIAYLTKQPNKRCKASELYSRQKTIRVLLTEDKAKYAIETLVRKFENETGYKVEIDAKPYPKMYQAVKSEWYRDNFDVFDLDIPWLSELVQKEVIEPIDSYANDSADYYNDVPHDILQKYCVKDGKIYGVPFTFCNQLLFYRKDYFNDITIKHMFYKQYHRELNPPKTWEEFNQVACFFTRKHNPYSPTEYGTTLGSRISSGGTCEFLPRLWAFGGEIFDASGFTINSKQALAALENYKESFLYAPLDSPDNWWPEQAQQFRDGKAAMMMTYADNITAVIERDKSKIIGKLGFALVPGKVSVMGGWVLAINAHSKNKQGAFEFMKWAGGKDLSIVSTILGGFVPCHSSLENLEILNIYPWLNTMLEASKYGKLREMPFKPNGKCMSEAIFEDVLGEAAYHAVTNQITPQNALNIANAKLNRLFFEEDE